MFRIITTSGVVEVTEDHSLVDSNGDIIKPNECEIGTKLMTKSFNNHNNRHLLQENIYHPYLLECIKNIEVLNKHKDKCLRYRLLF